MSEARPKLTRRRGACQLCRQKKIRCDGERPCGHCKKSHTHCHYPHLSATSPASQSKPLAPTPRTTPDGDVSSESLCNFNDVQHLCGDVTNFQTSIRDLFGGASSYSDSPASFDFSIPGLASSGEGSLLSDTSSNKDLFNNVAYNIWDSLSAPQTGIAPQSPPSTSPSNGGQAGSELDIQSERGRKRLRLNWELPQKTIPHKNSTSAYDPLVSEFSSEMSRGKKDRHLQDEAAVLMKKLMSRTTACCHPDLSRSDGDKEAVLIEFAGVPVINLVNRCFDEPGGVNVFLDRAEVLGAAEQLLDDSRPPLSVEQALIAHACIAYGSILTLDGDSNITQHFWSASLELKDYVMFRPDNIEKLTSLTTMLLVAERVGADFFDILLTTCVSVARSLRIHTTAALESLCSSHRQRYMLQRTCWLLSCIDKEESMRRGKFEIVCDSHIDYPLPGFPRASRDDSNTTDGDWLEIRHRYASLCSKINQWRIFPAGIGSDTDARDEPKVSEMIKELHAWYGKIPGSFQVKQHAVQPQLGAADKRAALSTFYRYHEALLLHCSKLCINSAGGRDSSVAREMRTLCTESIRAIFTVGIHVGNQDYAKDLTFLRVPVLAVCILITTILTDPPVPRDNRTPLLGMAAGLFGRLATTMPIDDLFQEFSELCQIAVQWGIRGT